MAGKELKATEKTVLKHSRDGVLEQNLADGSAKKVSNKAEEAVLKTARPDDERFDKLKAAGLVVEDVKKPDHRKLQFGRNNPDNTWAEAVYGNKPTEQLSFISDEKYQNSETSIPITAEEFAEMRQTSFKAEELKDFDFSKTRLKHSFCSDDEYTTSNEVVEATAEDLKPKSKLTFKCDDEYVNSEGSVEIDGAEFVGHKTEEKTESKLKDKKTRNSLKNRSSVTEKLTDRDGNSVFYYEGETPPDRKLTRGEKKLKRAIRKDEKKVYKLQKRLDRAENKLPHQRVFHVRKEWNSEKQKMQRKLKLEKEIKPLPKPNIVQKGVQGAKHAVSLTVSGAVHQQISKYEDENQTLKAAHGTEKVAESALRFASHKVKATNQKLKEKPYQKVSKLKFDTENAHKKLNQHKVALDHKTEQQTKKEAKKDAKKALKKAQQKQNQKKAAKTAKKGATTAGKKAGEAAKDVSQIIVKAVTNNKVVIIILVIFILLFGLLFTLGSSGFSSLADTGGMVIASSYTSDEEDIYAAENYMVSLENNLTNEINNIPNIYVGWNEYNYYLDPIQHDPYALISYLTAMKINFDYDADTQAKIQEIFNALYTLEVESIHEIRSYQYIEYDENGNEVLVTVYYDYYILNVTLTANDWESVVKPRLEAAGVYDVYLLLQETQGNKPDLF
ncbi:MAG: hypothetical protein PUB97_08240 [Ruminococcus sp.]|nr:hypothetical protein [Ruminococcus sp.]